MRGSRKVLAVGGPTLTGFLFVFKFFEGREDTAGRHRPASETPSFKWRFAGVPMMAEH